MKLDLYGTISLGLVLAAFVVVALYAPAGQEILLGALTVLANLLPSAVRRSALLADSLGDS